MDKPAVFTEIDLASIREGLAAFRAPGAYEPGKWAVSKYTRDPQVVGAVMPERVTIRDISMRVLEQVSGIIVSPKDRLRLIRAVAETGVGSMQLSAFRRGHTLDDMRREAEVVREVNPQCELAYGAVATEEEIALAAEAGYDAVEVWSTYLGKAAPSCAGAVYHRAWQDRDWRTLRFPKEPEEQVARSLRYIEIARRYGIEVGGCVNLLSICDDSYVDLYCRTVAGAGCREVVLADAAGGASPEVFAHMVQVARAAAPELTVGVHAHNNFGLAVACVIAGVKAGARLAEVSLNGYEEHPGNPDFAVVVTALEALYGVKTGIDMSRLVPLARLGEDLTGLRLETNHPVSGVSIFHDSGGDEYVQEQHIDPLIHASFTAELVGGIRKEGIGATTGPFSMWDKLLDLQIEIDSKEYVEAVLAECKARMRDSTAELSDAEVKEIARSLQNTLRGYMPSSPD